MNTSTKILDILIQELGAKTVAQHTGLKTFSKQDIIDAITHISTKNPSINEGSSTEEVRTDFIRLLIAHLFPEDPSVALSPSTPAPATTSVAKPPPVIKRGEKVIIKKKTDPVVKKLEPELEAVKEEPRYEAIIPAPPSAPSVSKEQGDDWLCGACNLPAGNDHRPCICTTYNFSVQAWEDARIFPKTQNKVIKVMKKVVKAAEKPAVVPAPAPAPVVVEVPVAVVKTTEEETKKPGRPKKAVKELPRCDSRIYGEKVEMEGTKAPNGGPLHCFKPAQCERKGPEKIAVNEDNEMRHLADGQEPAEDEGVQHLCKVCVKRWEARSEKAADWHGFFDDDVAPDTSHFEGGSWYQKKMAAIKKEQ
jgi:hypothetical protein